MQNLFGAHVFIKKNDIMIKDILMNITLLRT
jgi:hypothetical protein